MGTPRVERCGPAPGRFDWSTAVWMWIGFWAFGMLMSLVADLTTAAGAPFWLKALMFALLGLMAVGVAQAERLFHARLRTWPSEPINQRPARDDARPNV